MSDHDDKPGVWFVYGTDWNAYPKGVHDNELDARRQAMDDYREVVFWPFGVPWDEVKR